MTLYSSLKLLATWFQRSFFIIMIMNLWEQMTPLEWPLWTPGEWLVDMVYVEHFSIATY